MGDSGSFNPASITRAAPVLMRYYFVISLFTLVAFPFVLLAHSFKYRSLRYRFDDDGISMSWGVVFRREINLTLDYRPERTVFQGIWIRLRGAWLDEKHTKRKGSQFRVIFNYDIPIL